MVVGQATHPGTGADSSPPEFRAAVATMRAARLRPEVFCEEMPAPQRIAPYAAALTADGRLVTGCNIENASYGITLCAECSLVTDLVMGGGGQLVAFACVDGNGGVLMPCGRCRQLLYEHSHETMVLDTVSGLKTIDEVIPDAFGPRQLEQYRDSQS